MTTKTCRASYCPARFPTPIFVMKNFIVACLACFSINTNAQNTFNHQYDLVYQFNVLTSVLPVDSFIYATGVITDTIDHPYWAGVLFLKMDNQGEILVEKKLAPEDIWYEPWRGDLIRDAGGNLFDVGYQWDTTMSAYLMKYGPEGDTLFTKTYLSPFYPGEDFIVTASLKEKGDGNMYLLCGVDSDPNGADADICLMEVDKDGALLDTHVYGEGMVTEVPYSLVVDDDGGAIIGANKTNKGFVSKNFYSRTHVFKVDTLGGVVWEYETPNLQLFDIARDMVPTPDGGLVIATGKGIEHPINSESAQLRWNGYLLKLGAEHQKEWGVELRGTRHSAGTGLFKMAAAQDGSGYVCTGNLVENVTTGEEVYGSWVVKVSPQGDSLWARHYSYFGGIDSQPRPKDLKATPDGGYVIVGETKPDYPDGQGQRAWIMKLDGHGCLVPGCEEGDTVVPTTHLPVTPPMQLAIHPNPTTDYLNFQLRTPRHAPAATFRITDASGKVVREVGSTMPKGTHIVPVWDWEAGVYFLQYMEGGRAVCSERFVVLKE